MANTDSSAITDADSRTFSLSMVISGVRCGLTYVILPFFAPLVGIGSGVGPWVGLPLGLVAIGANVLSLTRFWSRNHKWKWPMPLLNVSVIVLLSALVFGDLRELAG